MTAKETLDLTASIPLQELPMKECVESILISVYTAAVVSDIATFHSCLIHLSILPDRWTCGLVNGLLTGLATILFFTKLSTIASTLPSPQILFSIQVLRYYTVNVHVDITCSDEIFSSFSCWNILHGV